MLVLVKETAKKLKYTMNMNNYGPYRRPREEDIKAFFWYSNGYKAGIGDY
jgi:hypothetical protein